MLWDLPPTMGGEARGGRPSLRMTTKTSLQTTPTKHTFDALTQLFWRHFKDVIIVFTVFLLFCLFMFFFDGHDKPRELGLDRFVW